MTYSRVIPRDLFNEASLLKCLGRLFIALENAKQHAAIMGDGAKHGALDDYSGEPFDIAMDESTGAIRVANLPFYVRGQRFLLQRPLNSREEWPLYVECDLDDDFEEIEVFTAEGDLTPDMRQFIGLEG